MPKKRCKHDGEVGRLRCELLDRKARLGAIACRTSRATTWLRIRMCKLVWIDYIFLVYIVWISNHQWNWFWKGGGVVWICMFKYFTERSLKKNPRVTGRRYGSHPLHVFTESCCSRKVDTLQSWTTTATGLHIVPYTTKSTSESRPRSADKSALQDFRNLFAQEAESMVTK